MIPESFIDELKYASDIERTVSSYVAIKRRGRNLVGLCPFHSERTPSFTVYPDTASYYCFGCGNGGDVITFIREIENLEYLEAVEFLAKQNGMTMPTSFNDDASMLKTKVLEINRTSARFFHDQLISNVGKEGLTYLNNRGLSMRTIRKFGLGFAPESWDSLKNHLLSKGFTLNEVISASMITQGRNNSTYDLFRNRIMFPIIDLRGNIIGFGGRLMGDKGPKYINSPDTIVFKKSRNLYALNFAKATGSDTLILGEGYMDVIAMAQAGFENSVATLGTALTQEQARLIAQYANNVVIAYDSDAAGQSATKRAINLFSSTNVSVSVLQLDKAKDPDEYIRKFGADKFARLIEGGKSAMDFEIDKLKNQYNLTMNEDKVAFLRDFCSLMAEIDNPLQRDVYIGQISRELDVSKDSINSTVEGIRKKRFYSNRSKESKELARGIAQQVGTDSKKRYNVDIEGAVAEEMLNTLLLLHPDYYKQVKGNLSSDDFIDEGYKKIFTAVSHRIEENKSLDLIHFSELLPNNLMAKLSQMLIKADKLKFYPEQTDEYVQAIKRQHLRKNQQELAQMTPEEFDDYMASLRADKF